MHWFERISIVSVTGLDVKNCFCFSKTTNFSIFSILHAWTFWLDWHSFLGCWGAKSFKSLLSWHLTRVLMWNDLEMSLEMSLLSFTNIFTQIHYFSFIFTLHRTHTLCDTAHTTRWHQLFLFLPLSPSKVSPGDIYVIYPCNFKWHLTSFKILIYNPDISQNVLKSSNFPFSPLNQPKLTLIPFISLKTLKTCNS